MACPDRVDAARRSVLACLFFDFSRKGNDDQGRCKSVAVVVLNDNNRTGASLNVTMMLAEVSKVNVTSAKTPIFVNHRFSLLLCNVGEKVPAHGEFHYNCLCCLSICFNAPQSNGIKPTGSQSSGRLLFDLMGISPLRGPRGAACRSIIILQYFIGIFQ